MINLMSPLKQRKNSAPMGILGALMVVALLFSVMSTAANATSLIAYTAAEGEQSKPSAQKEQHFECSEQIFTVLEVSDYPAGKYDLAVKWIDPTRDVREHTQYPFTVGSAGNTKLWAWLELSRAPGAAMISWLNPAAGLEEFVGTWDVEVKIDNRLVSTLQFDVIC